MSFNITYKGNSLVLPFEYKCLECGDISIIEHKRCEDMRNRKCEKCEGELSRYMTKAPCMDADYHDSLRYYNIGWNDNG